MVGMNYAACFLQSDLSIVSGCIDLYNLDDLDHKMFEFTAGIVPYFAIAQAPRVVRLKYYLS